MKIGNNKTKRIANKVLGGHLKKREEEWKAYHNGGELPYAPKGKPKSTTTRKKKY